MAHVHIALTCVLYNYGSKCACSQEGRLGM